MCPVCIATVAQVVAGATSTGGLATLIVKRLHAMNARRASSLSIRSKENANGSSKNRIAE
jgi:hypothetical protein